MIQGMRYVSSHYADDTQVLLPNLLAGTVSAFVAILQTFTRATGQAVSVPKSAMLPLGVQPDAPSAQPPPLAAPNDPRPAVAGFPVCSQVTVLRLPVCNQPVIPLQRTREGLRNRYRLPDLYPPAPASCCSAWSKRVERANAAASRISRLHLSALGRGQAVSGYALSSLLYHAEFDPPPAATLLAAWDQAANVVDGAALPGGARRRGVPRQYLAGKPRHGGFGLTPLLSHVRARHLVWACRLLSHLCSPPILQPAPSWLALASHSLRLALPGLHPAHALLRATIGTSVDIDAGLLSDCGQQAYLLPAGPLRRLAAALQALGPPVWLDGASGMDPTSWLRQPLQADAFLQGATAIGWEFTPPYVTEPMRIQPCVAVPSVAVATAAFQRHVEVGRWDLLQRYCAAAMATPPPSACPQPPSAPSSAQHLLQSLRQVLRIPWNNTHKELLWRLALNGVHAAGGTYRFVSPCQCGFQPTARQLAVSGSAVYRQHAFWDCPVAQAVRHQLQQQPIPPLQRYHLWLLQPPGPVVRRPVWQVMCLAALEAMELGRRGLWRIALSNPAIPAAACVAQASQEAVAHLRRVLSEFVSRPDLLSWRGLKDVGSSHPFISVRVVHPPLAPSVVLSL